jgi:hypothetical protein
MNRTGRIASLAGVSIAVLTGGILPASATLSDSVVRTTTVSTATVTVTPPTQVEAKTICTTTVDPVAQATTTVPTDVKIEWWESTSSRATGYRVTVHPSGGPAYTLATTGQTNEVFTSPTSIGGANPRISVTTLTGTNFTAQSSLTGIASC